MSETRQEIRRLLRQVTWMLPLFAVLAYLGSGFARVELGEQALLLRFGEVRARLGPGIHYHLPAPLGGLRRANVKRVRDVPLGRQLLTTQEGLQYFTGDENLVRIDGVVQYTIDDLRQHELLQDDPTRLVQELAIAELAAVVARTPVDDIFTSRKIALQGELRERLQARLERLRAGVRILSVNLTEVAPPRAVAEAFHAVSSARDEGHKLVSEAQGYANDTLPKARGKARGILDEAEAQRAQALAQARGVADSFERLQAEVRKSPTILKRERYLQTLGRVAARARVVADVGAKPSELLLQAEGLGAALREP